MNQLCWRHPTPLVSTSQRLTFRINSSASGEEECNFCDGGSFFVSSSLSSSNPISTGISSSSSFFNLGKRFRTAVTFTSRSRLSTYSRIRLPSRISSFSGQKVILSSSAKVFSKLSPKWRISTLKGWPPINSEV